MGLGGLASLRRGRAVELAADECGDTRAAAAGAIGQEKERQSFLPRLGITLALGALFVWLLSQRLADLDFAATAAAVWRAPWQAWAGAAGLTGVAFWAVGQYDVLLHRHFETGVAPARARAAGISAIAVSQVLGMGVITGAILRWRMLPDQSLWRVSRITVAVALSFLAGWAVVTAIAILALGPSGYAPAAGAVLGLAIIGAAAAVLRPAAPFRWPNLFTIVGLIGLCAMDTVAAAGALYVLLPPEAMVPFASLLPAFLLAYGAGMISGAPGGIGAFELALLALLPVQDTAPILAAVIAWRLVYFILPALLGAAAAMHGGGDGRLERAGPPREMQHQYDNLAAFIAGHDIGDRGMAGELGLMAQGDFCIVAKSVAKGGHVAQMMAARGHCVLGVLDPIGARSTAQIGGAMDILRSMAQQAGKWPALYKVGKATAAAARAQGWRVLRISREGGVALADYDLAAPSRAGLRRKLRRAAASGTVIEGIAPQGRLPIAEMAALSEAWARAHGGERGFSMGRFAPDYVAGQRVYLAKVNGVLAAFVTFHAAAAEGPRGEWTLDLMRHGPDLPDGVMHSLVHHAILDAKAHGAARMSLAAVPEAAFAPRLRKTAQLAARVLGLDTGEGLRRFKDAFAPDWQPRYLCAPHWAGVAFALASVWRAVVWTRGLGALPASGLGSLPAPLGSTLHNRFALPRRIWQERG